jgi:hypothetical protein
MRVHPVSAPARSAASGSHAYCQRTPFTHSLQARDHYTAIEKFDGLRVA